MSRLLVHTTMSLNGFIAGPNDEMDWAFEHAGAIPAALIDEVVARTGAILGGRRGYEVSRRAERRETSKPFGGRWSRPIFGLTHKPPEDETDPAYHFLSSDVRDAVATASAAAQGRDVLVLGANVVDQCLRERLVDEILIHVVPVLLGAGVRLFGGLGIPTQLGALDVSASGQVANLRYRVVK